MSRTRTQIAVVVVEKVCCLHSEVKGIYRDGTGFLSLMKAIRPHARENDDYVYNGGLPAEDIFSMISQTVFLNHRLTEVISRKIL